MTIFKTPKGTEIELIKLKSKDYMLVTHRLIWFNEEIKFYDMETEFLVSTPEETICSVTITIYDDNGRKIRKATGTKRETKKDFADHLEKAQSSATGRALGFLSFGTAQALSDFDEMTNEKGVEVNRLADAPVEPKESATPPPVEKKTGFTKKPVEKSPVTDKDKDWV